jgi:hypothetical protein
MGVNPPRQGRMPGGLFGMIRTKETPDGTAWTFVGTRRQGCALYPHWCSWCMVRLDLLQLDAR